MNQFEFYTRFWAPVLQCIADVERAGVMLDLDYLARQVVVAEDEIAEMYTRLIPWAQYYIAQLPDGMFNWNSPKQLSEFLYDFKRFPIPAVIGSAAAVKRNTKRARSTSEASLDWLAKNAKSGSDKDYLELLVRLRKTEKLVQFMRKLPSHVSADGRLRCSLGINTDTGRLSSKNPNLQNIPKRNDRFKIRRAFVAPQGKLLVVADYSQLEMYVMAHYLLFHYSDDSLAVDLLSGDAHTATALRVWHDAARRDDAKTVNYAIPYGKTAVGLGQQIKDASGQPIGKAAAQKILDDYFAIYPGLERLFSAWKQEARTTGYVRTLLGRTRPLPNAQSSDEYVSGAAERQAVNTPVQGGAADIVFMAMLRVIRDPVLRSLGAVLILQVHDELVLECPEEVAEQVRERVQYLMENPFKEPLRIQLKVDARVAATWNEAKA